MLAQEIERTNHFGSILVREFPPVCYSFLFIGLQFRIPFPTISSLRAGRLNFLAAVLRSFFI